MLEQFSRFGRELFIQGVNSSHSGHMSVRAWDRIFITRRGSMLSNLREGDIIETGMREDDSHINLASTEIKIHRDAAASGLQGGHGQGTRQLCRRPDAGRGISVDVQPGGVVQGAVPVLPAFSSRTKGGGRGMVTPCSSPTARLCAASPFTDRIKRDRKEAKLAPTAINQKGPELSAREANARPEMNSNGLNHLMLTPACLTISCTTGAMLTSASDKNVPLKAAALVEQVARGAA